MSFFKQEHAHVIVFGNEKGGTGKSTTAMHVVVGLLARGAKVAVIDLDVRQRSLTRYLENRRNYTRDHGVSLTLPDSYVVDPSNLPVVADRERDEARCLHKLVEELGEVCDCIVIDCPGNDTHLARVAHSLAATLITPLNDSFVDLDLLGQVHPENYEVVKLSLYAEAVWECRKRRALDGKRGLDWIVMRNRIATTESHNKRRVDFALKQLQEKIAFRYVPGLSERVIFRELFPKGLTLVDMADAAHRGSMTMSHIAARHELRNLLDSLRLAASDQNGLAEAS